jgi:alcohol dehydrogenase
VRAIGIPAAGQLDALGPVDAPEPSGEVRVRVVCSAVNAADHKVLGGQFAGRVLHARTKPLVAGYDFAGVVEADVDDLKAGDEVFGHLPYTSRNCQGAFAERVAVPRAEIAKKPTAVGADVAAASATPALTALQSFRDKGRLKAGGRVLVTGASGGVGSVAIGVARALGAHVTAVCSTHAVDFVRDLGADEVVDRKVRDPKSLEGPFDVVFDAAAAYSYAAFRHALAPGGGYVSTLPDAGWVGGKLLATFSSKHTHFVIVKSARADLEQIGAWLAAGMKVPIDSRFPVADLRAALARQASGEVRGRVVVDVAFG